jgi:hypothetical protein
MPRNTDPSLTVVDPTDKLELTIKAMEENSDITDEELAVILSLTRPASARFWRLKADELLRMAAEQQA